MKNTLIISVLVTIVAANPVARPQFVDFYSVVTSAGPPPVVTMAVGAYSQIVYWNPSSVAAAAAAEITSDPVMQYSYSASASSGDGLYKRATATACATQLVGYGPKPTVDTPSAFLAYKPFAAAASAAAVPEGYEQTFENLNASNNAYGYMGYTTLMSYNASLCSSQCDDIFGCSAFNICKLQKPSPLNTPQSLIL